jgi:hypothetical protein
MALFERNRWKIHRFASSLVCDRIFALSQSRRPKKEHVRLLARNRVITAMLGRMEFGNVRREKMLAIAAAAR